MDKTIKIRQYTSSDIEEIAQLFYDTVHGINIKDYSKDQVNVWANQQLDLRKWNDSFVSNYTYIACIDTIIVGFGDIDQNGYLDHLYVHKDYQGRGIATALCNKLERKFEKKILTTHASITAKTFFENRGYTVVKSQQINKQGVLLTNFLMEKKLF